MGIVISLHVKRRILFLISYIDIVGRNGYHRNSKKEMGTATGRVLLFGTFDVGNYGDLLFPVVAQKELEIRGLTLTHVSPTNRTTVFEDAVAPVQMSEIPDEFVGVMVGGGNIINLDPGIYGAFENVNYHDLWIGATSFGVRSRVPVIFNCPGCSLPSLGNISKIQKFFIRATFKNAEILRFRDSVQVVSQYSNRVHKVTPDTAFGISDIWPKPKRREQIVVLNLNERYFPESEKVAGIINTSEVFRDRVVSFVIIGECHGDLAFTRDVQKHLDDVIQWKEVSMNLKNIAEEIAVAELFIGSSMHGFITALSYRTRCILVNNHTNPLQKFKDLFLYAELDESTICRDFLRIDDSFRKCTTISDLSLAKIKSELLEHWDELAQAIREKRLSSKITMIEQWSLKRYKSILRFDAGKTKYLS